MGSVALELIIWAMIMEAWHVCLINTWH